MPDSLHDTPAFCPNAEQDAFLTAFTARVTNRVSDRMRLMGGPGTGKSRLTIEAARAASDEGYVVFLLAPTHQAVGVLSNAALDAALPARKFVPDPKRTLHRGKVLTGTTHSFARWIVSSRSRDANRGVEYPITKDSWIGRSLRPDWSDPPTGVVVMTDEISMYPDQMSRAIDNILDILRANFRCVIHVAIGDPDQLTPVRGNSYTMAPHEQPNGKSRYVTDPTFRDYRLVQNMRAKDPALLNVVQTYKQAKVVMPPPGGFDLPGAAYRWTNEGPAFWEEWADKVRQYGEANCILMGYRRATVAGANDKLCKILRGRPAYDMGPGEDGKVHVMRTQETYSPRQTTMFYSSEILIVEAVREITDEDEVLRLILPPEEDHDNVHHPVTIAALGTMIEQSLLTFGPFPAAVIQGTTLPAVVLAEQDTQSPTARRWDALLSALSNAAFRSSATAANSTLKRGMTAMFYHLSDAALLKLEPPYAMTSHRAQGSSIPHVGILADNQMGQRLVDVREDTTRDASSYVMLSRASRSLTVAWQAPPAPYVPLVKDGWF